MNFKTELRNLPGWRTGRKIVVFESDDWGSIRMPSAEVYQTLESQGLNLTAGDTYRYNRYDSLATAEDLSALYDALSSFKDQNGRHPVFTAVSVVANPDFEKIRAADFREYHYEPFTETLNRYHQCQGAFKLWQQGMERRLFVPQFHGREHLNVQGWLKALRGDNKEVMTAFEHGMWGFVPSSDCKLPISLQAAFDLENPEEIPYHQEIIREGLELFGKIFGYRAKFFVPPNGPFCSQLEETAAECGVQYMSTAKVHREPLGSGVKKVSYRWMGRRNSHGQRYLTRNCFFEPSNESKEWVDSCLTEVASAFRWQKPAVISTHRVNYIGALEEGNRTKGLNQLKSLISEIVKKWQNVEFMSSDELGDVIASGN